MTPGVSEARQSGVGPRCLLPVLAVILLGHASLTAQTDIPARSPSLALHMGLYSIAREEFGNTYGSNASFIAGGELGVPVSRNVDVFLSVMRFASSGIPRVKIYAYVNTVLVQVGEISEGAATYSQVNIHGGLRFNHQLNELLAIVGQIGLAGALVSEHALLPTGETLVEYSRTGFGFFASVGFERRFVQSSWALFVNGGYDIVRVLLSERLVEVGGGSVTAGIRKYF